ncbi:D-alanyl-D-alanine carboxypeptidase/D-alanyl-D-alanine-endopeptidase [Nocardia panacis]|uniref:D-alanyl-D-alanine carboxypeptidase/D-alanyl-D-alanine-endopeptidase n=1 Tax=Nocardia panacis TaxID=2340916 RepID=A0A3A4KQ53_9NOCA|nr:D-alanyl-D-alanine carboxypeptidase/D-alanyl-D-alanine-endopeptidase [Nocardia panacis]
MGGLAARRRRNTWIVLGTASTLFVAAAAVVLAVAKPWTPEFRHGGLTVPPPPTTVRAYPQVVPAPQTQAAPTPAGIVAALAPVVGNPDLGSFAGEVTDAATGTVLWSGDSGHPMIPASTAKVLTAAAALLAVPPDHRLGTRVVVGSAPNEAVLVGGGDPTLTAEPDGKGYYTHAPRLSDLVAQIRAAGRNIDTVVVDNSAYAGPTLAPGWDPADIGEGSIAPMDPVMLDGGRLKPLIEYSPRTETPALDTGRRLATELGLDPGRVRAGKAAPGATQLAAVESATLRDRLQDMMIHSDDVLAEAIGREIAMVGGVEASFDGAVSALQSALGRAGLEQTGLRLKDTSGLSTENLIPPRLLDRVLAIAAKPHTAAVSPGGVTTDSDRVGAAFAPLLDTLPVAGGTGSLTDRYTVKNRQGAGWVRAKTGTLSVSSALAGYVLDTDGRVLTFALMSNDRPPEVSRPALDAIAGALRNCGCS